jgi:hypothetical protein
MNKEVSSLSQAHVRGSFARLVLESETCNGPNVGPSAHSILFRLIQILVLCIRLITPLSYVFILYLWYFPRPISYMNGGSLLYSLFTLWMLAEALFFPYYYYLFTYLNNNMNDGLKHYATDRVSRMQLALNCFEAISLASGSPESPELYIRKVFSNVYLVFVI